jgi:hypothetical protein
MAQAAAELVERDGGSGPDQQGGDELVAVQAPEEEEGGDEQPTADPLLPPRAEARPHQQRHQSGQQQGPQLPVGAQAEGVDPGGHREERQEDHGGTATPGTPGRDHRGGQDGRGQQSRHHPHGPVELIRRADGRHDDALEAELARVGLTGGQDQGVEEAPAGIDHAALHECIGVRLEPRLVRLAVVHHAEPVVPELQPQKDRDGEPGDPLAGSDRHLEGFLCSDGGAGEQRSGPPAVTSE